MARIARPDNLIRLGGRVIVSSGHELVEVDLASRALRPLREFEREIACIAARADGLLAVGMVDGDISFGYVADLRASWRKRGIRVACPTAMTFDAQGDLIVCQGSKNHTSDRWKHDLLERGSSGCVWRIGSDGSAAECLADGLAFPFGVVPYRDGLAVSESWAHRVIHIDGSGRSAPLISDLPGYPARIVSSREGYWLCVFAPRSQLVEFVLREERFRQRMMREVDTRYWIAPTLSASRSYLDPMQGGGMVTQGQLKPWAPTRSYGLVIRLDGGMRPVDSVHSRADGSFHGVTSCLEAEHELLVASNGSDALLALALVDADRTSGEGRA